MWFKKSGSRSASSSTEALSKPESSPECIGSECVGLHLVGEEEMSRDQASAKLYESRKLLLLFLSESKLLEREDSESAFGGSRLKE